jgi:nicotinate-nucleotide adenylyltransferase
MPGIDALWIVPTHQHAFDKPLPDFPHRLRMCQIAFAGVDRTQVLDIEQQLGGRNLMVRTLEALLDQHPNVRLRLVIGSDLVNQLDRWTEPDRIRALAPLLVVQREGSSIVGMPGPMVPAVSSTEIREHLVRGDDASQWLPPAVIDYITQHRLYRDATPTPASP